MSAPRLPLLPTGLPGMFEPPLATRVIRIVHPRSTATVELEREIGGEPGACVDLSSFDLTVTGTLANERGVCFEVKALRALVELRDVLDAAIRQAEADDFFGEGPSAPPPPPRAGGRAPRRRLRYRPDAGPDGGAA